MARIPQVLMKNKAWSASEPTPQVDLAYGGQFGWTPVLTEWVSNQAYIRRNLVCVLLEAPRLFQKMPDPPKWVQTLRSLVELHPLRIEGLNAGLTVETAEHAVGGAGEMQREFTNVTRARTDVTFTYSSDKYGNPIQTFLDAWIRYGMMDPDTKTALMGTIDSYDGDMLADMYSFSAVFFEPTPEGRKVHRAWVVTNMFPVTTGDIIGKRDLTSASEISELSINVGGIAQYGNGAVALAQKLLDAMNFNGANPMFMHNVLDDESADVKAANKNFQTNMEQMAKAVLGTAASPLDTGFVSAIEGKNAVTGNGDPLAARNEASSSAS
jgi:hypothetical protein